MYQLISAQAKSPDLDGRYYPVNLATMPLWQVYSSFVSVIATVNHTSDPTPVFLDLWDLPYSVRASAITLPQYFASIANRALPTTDATPIGDFISVRYADVWLNDFDVRPANRYYHPDVPLAYDQQTDILITKPGVDYQFQAKRILATVNGFVHRVDNTAQGLIVYDGGKTRDVAGNNQLGFIDFSLFGEIQTIAITDAMIYSRDDEPLKNGVYLQVPVDLRNKTVFLVIGGYLHALDTAYKVTGIHSIKVDFINYGWVNRYFNSRDVIDYSDLEIVSPAGNRENLEELLSDRVIRNLFKMSQSFLVVLNHTDIDCGYLRLDDTDIPGTYRTFFVPTAPMVMADGRMGEYRTSTEHGQYAVTTHHYVKKNRILETGSTNGLLVTTDSAYGSNRYDYSGARFLMITKTIMEGS